MTCPKFQTAQSLEEEQSLHAGLVCQRAGQGHPRGAFGTYLDKAGARPWSSLDPREREVFWATLLPLPLNSPITVLFRMPSPL